jgi:hypothetical protein
MPSSVKEAVSKQAHLMWGSATFVLAKTLSNYSGWGTIVLISVLPLLLQKNYCAIFFTLNSVLGYNYLRLIFYDFRRKKALLETILNLRVRNKYGIPQ